MGLQGTNMAAMKVNMYEKQNHLFSSELFRRHCHEK